VRNQQNIIVLNTVNNLHAELEIENYKYYCRTNGSAENNTSRYTGVNILSCRACADSLENSEQSSIVSGGHDGNYPSVNPTVAYILPNTQQIYELVTSNQQNAAIALMPYAQIPSIAPVLQEPPPIAANNDHRTTPLSPRRDR